MKRRYRALRKIGCGWFTSFVIAALNDVMNVPPNEVRFMHIIIELEDEEN